MNGLRSTLSRSALSRSARFPAAQPVIVALLLASVGAAQVIGPQPAIGFVSPLYDRTSDAPQPNSAAREAARLTAERIKRLAPIHKRLESARNLEQNAAKAATPAERVRHLRLALERGQLARKRLDRLRQRYERDAGFVAAADQLGFTARKDIARFQRSLDAAIALRAELASADAARRAEAGPDPVVEARPSSRPSDPASSPPSSPRSAHPTARDPAVDGRE